MEYTPPLTRNGTTFELDRASELSDLPPLWAIPNLIPCHRLSLIVAPSGGGLTALACNLAASLAPTLPQFLDATTGATGMTGAVDTTGTTTGTAGVSPACIDPSPEPQLEDPPPQPPDTDSSRYEMVNNHYPSPPPASLVDAPYPAVLLITDRDNPDVLKPRLQALGADLDRILILSKVYHHHPSPNGYKPPMDTAEPFAAMDHNELSELLHEHRGIRLVLIDNAELLFSDYNRPARSRIQRQLSLLQAVANKREVAIVLLTSIPKLCSDPFRGALLSTFRDTARMVYLLAPDLQDPSSHLLFNLKNTLPTPIPNLQPLGTAGVSPACTHSLLKHQEPGAKHLLGHPTTLTYPHYLHQRHHQATRGPDPLAHDYTAEVLVELLSHGPLRVGHRKDPDPNTLYQLTQAAGVNWHTVGRVKKTLQITSTKEGTHWFWRLPPTIPTKAFAASQPLPRPQESHLQTKADETCQSSPPNEAQLLTSPAPTTQKDICATPAILPSQEPLTPRDAPDPFPVQSTALEKHSAAA